MAQQAKEAWYDAPSKPVTAFKSLDKESATPIEQPSFNMTKEEENSVLFLVGSRMASTGAHGIPNHPACLQHLAPTHLATALHRWRDRGRSGS